jgi:two-component system, cell cycle sensor histidine kinase and response regulator CckA
MGLAASLGIVQSHKGRLLITSQPGRGTLATVWLPSMASDEVETADAAPSAMFVNAPHGTETILIVEPDPAVSHTAEQILASLGYCVVTRNDLEPALGFLTTNCEDVDLVILNINMPSKSGPDVVELTLERCGEIPLLLFSGYEQAAEAAALLDLGAAAFLQKPFSLMSLAQAVRSVLDDPARPKRDKDI